MRGFMSLDKPSPGRKAPSGCRVALLAARYNERHVDALIAKAKTTLEAAGTAAPVIERVPGSAELPCAAATLLQNAAWDAVIVLGVVIAGETEHHRVIAHSTARALQDLACRHATPVINGILLVDNAAQADARCGGSINRGAEFAEAALEMAQFKKKWTTPETT